MDAREDAGEGEAAVPVWKQGGLIWRRGGQAGGGKGEETHLAKAYVMRLLVVMMLMVAKRRQTRGKLLRYGVSLPRLRFPEWTVHPSPFHPSSFHPSSPHPSSFHSLGHLKRKKATHTNKQILPAILPVASPKMANSGPSAAEITSSMSPATNSRQVRKTKPVKTPMPTQAIMMRGPSTVGLGISSIMCATAKIETESALIPKPSRDRNIIASSESG